MVLILDERCRFFVFPETYQYIHLETLFSSRFSFEQTSISTNGVLPRVSARVGRQALLGASLPSKELVPIQIRCRHRIWCRHCEAVRRFVLVGFSIHDSILPGFALSDIELAVRIEGLQIAEKRHGLFVDINVRQRFGDASVYRGLLRSGIFL